MDDPPDIGEILIFGSVMMGLIILVVGTTVWLTSLGVPIWAPVGSLLVIVGLVGAAIKGA